jgi:hypothetical protein
MSLLRRKMIPLRAGNIASQYEQEGRGETISYTYPPLYQEYYSSLFLCPKFYPETQSNTNCPHYGHSTTRTTNNHTINNHTINNHTINNHTINNHTTNNHTTKNHTTENHTINNLTINNLTIKSLTINNPTNN